MAKHDLHAMNKYKAFIEKAGYALNIDPAVIAGEKVILLLKILLHRVKTLKLF